MTGPEEVSMHPMMMIALSHEIDGDRQRDQKRIERRSLARQQRQMGATDSTTRAAGHECARRLLVVSRLLMRLS